MEIFIEAVPANGFYKVKGLVMNGEPVEYIGGAASTLMNVAAALQHEESRRIFESHDADDHHSS